MTGNDIIKNALEFKDYVYWYGGKRQKCTTSLLNTLSRLYPSVYNTTYILKCKNDIKNGKYTIDCSGLVCGAYKIPDIGSSQIRNTFKVWHGYPKNGMVCWRKGHVGLYVDGHTFEASGVDYDVRYVPYDAGKWSTVLYLDSVDYDTLEAPVKPIPATVKVKPNKINWVVNTKTSPLALRLGDGTKYGLIDYLPKGTTVGWFGYTNKKGDWYYVSVNVGAEIKTGWVCKRYLK